jgi:hypothetical protein
MLGSQLRTRILDFVRQKPRTIQEVSHLLDRNWRTAERYVDTIGAESGLLATRTFREGTRGALKIVYWNALDRAKGSAYQERLLARISAAKNKEDFSPLDIYQVCDPQKREAHVQHEEFSHKKEVRFDTLLSQAKEQVLFFSGNLSWMELGPDMNSVLEELGRKKVRIKVLTRVDMTSLENTERMLSLNERLGWDAVEIRHCEQPLRAVVVDDGLASIKEVLSPAHVRELKTKMFIFYLLRDPEWVNWLQKVFWHLWSQSIDAKERIEALRTLQ